MVKTWVRVRVRVSEDLGLHADLLVSVERHDGDDAVVAEDAYSHGEGVMV